MCVGVTYTYAHNIGQGHRVAKYNEIVVAEYHLQSLQKWRRVLREGRVLGRKHRQGDRGKRDVSERCNPETIFESSEPVCAQSYLLDAIFIQLVKNLLELLLIHVANIFILPCHLTCRKKHR